MMQCLPMTILENLRVIPYLGVVADIRVAAQINLLPELGRQEPGRTETPVPAIGTLLSGGIFQKVSQGLVSVLDPDEGWSDRLFGLEIIVDQQDTRLARINVLLVLWIGIEAKLAGLSMLYLSE